MRRGRLKLLFKIKAAKEKGEPSDLAKEELERSGIALFKRMELHYQQLSALVGYNEWPTISHTEPEAHVLHLPSSFSAEQRERNGMSELSKAELSLRIGHAYDLLKELKKSLSWRSHLYRHTRESYGFGYSKNQRENETISRAAGKVNLFTKAYRTNFRHLERLGATAADLGPLRTLQDSDTVMLANWIEGQQYTNKDTSLPWIWTMLMKTVDGESEIQNEALRIQVQRDQTEGKVVSHGLRPCADLKKNTSRPPRVATCHCSIRAMERRGNFT